MQEILLKNGSKEVNVLVASCMMSLNRLYDEQPLAVFDLARKCNDPDYEVFGPNIEVLERYSLIDSNGAIHGSIKNIVLSAIEGDGLDMTLGSPVAE